MPSTARRILVFIFEEHIFLHYEEPSKYTTYKVLAVCASTLHTTALLSAWTIKFAVSTLVSNLWSVDPHVVCETLRSSP